MFQLVSHNQLGTALLLAVLLTATECATRYVAHAGAINKADSAVYDAAAAPAKAGANSCRIFLPLRGCNHLPCRSDKLDAHWSSYLQLILPFGSHRSVKALQHQHDISQGFAHIVGPGHE